MAARTHYYGRSLLSMIENGRRSATSEVTSAYESVLGVGGLGEAVNRRDFLKVMGIAAGNATVISRLTASLAGNDPTPLINVQTTHGIDLAVATLADRRTLVNLRGWLDDGSPMLRVNAAGILAKVPGQADAIRVSKVLSRDAEVRSLYMTAVVSRVCSLEWTKAAELAANPRLFPQPGLVAQRFAQEAVSDRDGGARWCSAVMLQSLSPMIGR